MRSIVVRVFPKIIFFLIFIVAFTGCCPQRFSPGTPVPMASFVVPERIRVALVLGSGGVRGMAHVGVLEELEAAGIPIDLIVGCSAGSIVGALYADHPNVEAIKKAVWEIRTNLLLDIDLWNCRYGLSQGRTMRKILNQYLSVHNFEQLKIPLVIVATDLNSGELVPIASGNLDDAVVASCSIPLLYVPCQHYGRVLVDGGIINPVPVRVAKDLGAEFIIAVDLSELLPKTFPTNLFGVAARSAEIAFMWQNERCTRNADIIMRPKTCGVGTFNDRLKQIIYEAGRRAAREHIPQIKQALAQIERVTPWKCGWKHVTLNPYPPQIYCEELDPD